MEEIINKLGFNPYVYINKEESNENIQKIKNSNNLSEREKIKLINDLECFYTKLFIKEEKEKTYKLLRKEV